MAKPKKPQSQGFSFEGYDRKQFSRSDQYAAAIDQLYNAAIADFAKLASQIKLNPDKIFSFDQLPNLQAKAQQIVNDLASKMTAVIQHGSKESWLYACKKNDAFLAHIMDTAKIGKRQLKKMQDKNLTALDAFQQRKVSGMDLSQRVWRYAGETKNLIEMGLDVAIGDGKPAADLAKELKKYLKEPNMLFRRVRDKHGDLQLSKRAAAYHPGRGVYRSSYQNALRMTRTEINMAYRDSDRYRWNQLDFVVGYEVKLSNNHTTKDPHGFGTIPLHDICDELAGHYPKTFVFKGWHPNCRCYCVPILKDPKEFKSDQEKALHDAFWGDDDDFDANGDYRKYMDPNQSVNAVTDVPKAFKDWAKKNKERSKGWAKQPYFIRDNFTGGTLDGDLKIVKPVIPQPKANEHEDWKKISDKEQKVWKERWQKIVNRYVGLDGGSNVSQAVMRYGIDDSLITSLISNQETEYWKADEAEAEVKRLTQRCDQVRDQMAKDIQPLLDRTNDIIREDHIWGLRPAWPLDHVRNMVDIAKTDEWPDYARLESTFNRNNTKCEQSIQDGKAAFHKAIDKANDIIGKNKESGVDLTELKRLIQQTPSLSEPAPTIIKKIEDECQKINQVTLKPTQNFNIPKYVTDAKNVKELESKLMANGRVSSCDLSKASLDDAKTIAGTAMAMSERFNLNKMMVNVTSFGRGQSNAIAHANGGKVEVNTKYYSKRNAKTNGAELYDNCVANYLKNHDQTIQNIKSWIKECQDRLNDPKTASWDIKWYQKTMRGYEAKLKKYENIKKAGFTRHNVMLSKETTLQDTVIHECGHAVHDQILGGINGTTYRQARFTEGEAIQMNYELENLYKKYEGSCSWLSEYGSSARNEFMAESMVLYIRRPSDLPDDVRKWFEKLEKMAHK